MFTIINFHISMMVGFFVVIFFLRFSFIIWAMTRQNLQNTKIRLRNDLGYTAAQSNEYFRLVLNGQDRNLMHPYSNKVGREIPVAGIPTGKYRLLPLKVGYTGKYWEI